MDRRTALGGVAGLVGAGFVIPDLDRSDRLDHHAAAERTRQLRADYAAGHAGALDALEDHAAWLKYFFHHDIAADAGRAGVLFADAAQSLALWRYKAEDYANARWWAEAVQDAGEKLSDTDILAVGLVRRAMVSIGSGRPHGAVYTMSRALEIGASPHARYLVEVHLARALSGRAGGQYGRDDDVDQALRALDRAEALVEQADQRGLPRPPYASGLGEVWMTYHRGDVLTRHRPKQANLLLISAAQQLQGDRQARAWAQIRQAEALAAIGHVEQAVSVAKDALVVPSMSGARREVRRVENLHARLAASFPSAILHPLRHALAPHQTRQVRGSTSFRGDRRRP